MKAKDLDKRILQFLHNRGYETDSQINEFLNPSTQSLNNPFDLKGMNEAVGRIKEAIRNKENIVIYGDYDCDGISACVILYKYFLSKGIKCDVYIPNRFDDGYGLSFDMIDEVIVKSHPNLILTVDLGITAIEEIKEIKKRGVDIIVTDHHEPMQELPDCICVDPKIQNQKYPFNGLCGAGVALKLVEALEGREEIFKYLDVCAIATIGDIVPLINENRLIAKNGIEKLNSGECLESYKYMMRELGLKNVSASDITFRIVPRINACGRMSNGKKVFNFLIEEDNSKLPGLFQQMINDNELRLKSISEGVDILETEMKNIDLSQEMVILLKGDFHQGVLGILASRICHDYNRPAIIFTRTEEGVLKGSGRSLDDIDLHESLENIKHILSRFGGHKMAVGVEVEEKNFGEFKRLLTKEIAKKVGYKSFVLKEHYDIKIDEKDINKDFINQIDMLEPFGCKNEKPILMMETKKLNVQQMKDLNFKHFKLQTAHKKSIIAFSFEKHIDTIKSSANKQLILDLENNCYQGKVTPQAILKNVYLKEVKLDEDKERECMLSLIAKYNSGQIYTNQKAFEYDVFELESLLNKLKGNGFGTLVIVDSFKVAERVKNFYKNLKNYTISHIPPKNKQNTILVSNRFPIEKADIQGYNNVVFTRKMFSNEKNYFLGDQNIYVVKKNTFNETKLDGSRNVNIAAYNLIKKYAGSIHANNIFEWLEKIQSVEGGLSKAQLLFSCLAFEELGFVKISFCPEFKIELVSNPPKRELSSSKFMNKLMQRSF